MPNRSNDELFQLIKSLDKTEKRLFKLYVKRISGTDDLKMITLFDALDKMEEYDEDKLLQKNKSLKKQQLSNMKTYLYRQILSCLRQVSDDDNVDMQLHEQMGYARILYNKGLYHQSLKVLDKLKQNARLHYHVTYQLQALIFEKKIEALHITRSIEDKAWKLSNEVEEVNTRIVLLSKLSNLSLQLYGLYIKNGHARNENDISSIKKFFESNLPVFDIESMDFYEKLYLYQSYSWYHFILQDFLQYYRYTQRWADLFADEPQMIPVESSQYIKALHNLLTAHFVLHNYSKYKKTIELFEKFSLSEEGNININTRTQNFVYLGLAKLNIHFTEGTFTEGIALVDSIEKGLKEYRLLIDPHRTLVFYYKIACIYFGSGNNEKAILYLNKIINWKVDLRTDLQCYARLLQLIAHYELGNDDILEYLVKSVYRFMGKMQHLSRTEEEVFIFLRKAFSLTKQKLLPEFIKLKDKLKALEGNAVETRSFMYLDIISWLESKIERKPVQKIIQEKFAMRLKENK